MNHFLKYYNEVEMNSSQNQIVSAQKNAYSSKHVKIFNIS